MIMNKIRLVHAAARVEGFELDHINVTDIKPVNIYLSGKLDTAAKGNVTKGLESLKMLSVNFSLEEVQSAGKFAFPRFFKYVIEMQ